jgi:hypothetical protein
MRPTRAVPLAIATVAAFALSNAAAAADRTIDFDEGKAGQVPANWELTATHGGDKRARWIVEETKGPRGDTKVFSLVEPEATGILARVTAINTYNIAWLPDAKAKDVDMTVAIRANDGDVDQGGGLIWRAKDQDNYYIARYNPLERNFRVYYVKDGKRQQLSSTDNLKIGTGEWFTMRVVQRGDTIEGYVNGDKLATVRDATFKDAGAVGLWTKADAKTSFDNLVIKDL